MRDILESYRVNFKEYDVKKREIDHYNATVDERWEYMCNEYEYYSDR